MLIVALLIAAVMLLAPYLPSQGTLIFSYWNWQEGERGLYALDRQQHTVAPLTVPGTNATQATLSPDGRIAYVQYGINGLSRIYVMDSNGRHKQPLTQPGLLAQHPAWSPDGSQIAFQGSRNGSVSQIFIMNADGSDPRQVTASVAFSGDPSWSPDGSQLAYRSDGAGEIMVLTLATGQQRQLTNTVSWAEQPAWSPDGEHIVFMHNLPNQDRHLYIVRADGSDQRMIPLPSYHAEHPTWSPDGRTLLFEQIQGRTWLYTLDWQNAQAQPQFVPIEWVADTSRDGIVANFGAVDELVAIWRP
jgi:TolB protein